ncbi:hypothetical protein E2C01_071950 [Portunus trituberculatus]|uniref:Uncharacterized protein n=1 Tax=Portunus trituberculatus TaxID=210409 RepID=A0A5B7I9T0_PORTR|nr:hypothetical protein [Portunus trituberculatus]
MEEPRAEPRSATTHHHLRRCGCRSSTDHRPRGPPAAGSWRPQATTLAFTGRSFIPTMHSTSCSNEATNVAGDELIKSKVR